MLFTLTESKGKPKNKVRGELCFDVDILPQKKGRRDEKTFEFY